MKPFATETLQHVCSTLNGSVYDLYFPEGLIDMVKYIERSIDIKLLNSFVYSTESSISQKIEKAVFDRLILYTEFQNYKRLVQGIKKFLYSPMNWSFILVNSFNIVDNIWSNIVRDQSTDFNFYTKRTILTAIYQPCFNSFCNDNSEKYHYTQEVVHNAVKKVKSIHKIKKKLGLST